jgi:NAD(P)-dependent dehydrogenase (short-subunit alcohol dehydrogenase family)
MRLEGINAIVTGANQGLGLEIARQFLREGAGVAICARDTEKLASALRELQSLATARQRIVAFQCDVSDESAVRNFVHASVTEIGPIQVLVNNAGVYGPKGPSEGVDWEEWKRALEINLYGVMLPTRLILPHLKNQGWGKIINVSGGGATQPLPFLSAYAASKAAVVRLTETLAEELRTHGIDVNAVAPGALNTRLLDEVLQAGPQTVGDAFFQKALKQRDAGGVPLTLGASLCVYLASHESDGVTGKLLSAQWDPWKDLERRKEMLDKTDIYTLRRIVPEDRGEKWT